MAKAIVSRPTFTIQIVSIVILSAIATSSRAIDVGAEFAAAEVSYRAGDFNGALQRLEPLLVSDDLDQPAKQRARAIAASVLHQRGEDHFRHARIKESIADFDRQLQLQPDRAAQHWQRGIAYFYAGEYEKGANQFELHRSVNPQDVENAAWHFLCVTRAPNGSVAKARLKLIEVTRDTRVPMAEIQQMFGGTMKPEEVSRAGETAGGTAKFYAELYVGLYYEALERNSESLRLIAAAAENPAAKDNFMGDVARVHVTLRKKVLVRQAPTK